MFYIKITFYIIVLFICCHALKQHTYFDELTWVDYNFNCSVIWC